MSRAKLQRFQDYTHELRLSIGRLSSIVGPTSASRATLTSPHAVKHWQRKYTNPLLRIGKHGGAREGNRLMTRTYQQIVEFHAWQILKYDPRYTHTHLHVHAHV